MSISTWEFWGFMEKVMLEQCEGELDMLADRCRRGRNAKMMCPEF